MMENVSTEELRKNVFRNANGLVVLDLRIQQLSHVPQAVLDLDDVQVLDLRGNRLVDLPSRINKLKNLRELYLSNNELTKLPESVGELLDLVALRVNGNQLTKLPTSIKNLTKLEELHLNNNQIKDIDDIIYLEQLRFLHLEHNQLSVLPTNFRHLKKLQKLFLNNNQIKRFPEDILCLEELTWLTLSKNHLSKIPSEIKQLKKLQVLYISDNNLNEIPHDICDLNQLIGLNLDGNPLNSDDEGVESLKELHKKRRPYVSIKFPASVFKPEEQLILREDRKTVFEGKVTVEGASWNFKEAGTSITFPPMAVTIPKHVTCSLLTPRNRLPLKEDEILVSNITELSSDSSPGLAKSSKGFNRKVKVALSHCAPDLRGYEVVIKALLDKERNEWKDLETRSIWKPSDLGGEHLRDPELAYPFAEVKTDEITHCSSFAVIWRLKSFIFHKPSSKTTEFNCTVTEFPSVSVTVPQSCIPANEDFSIKIKVQEVPRHDNTEQKVGPVIHISCSEEVELLQPATITIPLTLRDDDEELRDAKLSQVRIFSSKDESFKFADFSEEVRPVDLKDGVVTFHVNHFSLYWPWLCAASVLGLTTAVVNFFYKRCRPQPAGFLACLCESDSPDTLALILRCCPRDSIMKEQKRIYSSKFVVCYYGEVEQACYHGDIFYFSFVFFTLDEEIPEEEMQIKFLRDETGCPGYKRNVLYVRRDVEDTNDPQIKFFKRLENGGKDLVCTLSLLPVSRGSKKRSHKEQKRKTSVAASQTVSNRQRERKVSEPASQEVSHEDQEAKKILQQPRPDSFSVKTLNVVTVGDEWGSSKGGMSTINRDLAIHFARQPNVRVTFLVLDNSYNEEEETEAKSYKIDIFEVTSSNFRGRLDGLFKPTRDLCISFVVGHGVKFGRYAKKIKDMFTCKWMQVLHTAPEKLAMHKEGDSMALLKGEQKSRAEVELCKMADIVVAIGPALKNDYTHFLRGTEKKVIELTPGIVHEFKGLHSPEVDDVETFEVLLFGRDDANDFKLKGYDIAAEAFANDKLKDKPYTLLFVGAADKDGANALKNGMCRYGINLNQLIINSCKNRRELKEVFRRADLAIMPSRTEGFGLTGLEALSAGLPILVSGNSGFAAALTELPFGKSCIVDSMDPQEWAEAITRVLPLKDIKGRRRALQEVQQLLESYEKEYRWEEQCQILVDKMWSMTIGEETPQRDCKYIANGQITAESQSVASEHTDALSPLMVTLGEPLGMQTEEKKEALNELQRLTREEAPELREENLNTLLSLITKNIGDDEPSIRLQSLRLLTDLVQTKPHAFRRSNDKMFEKVLIAHEDPEKEIAVAAEDAARIIVVSLPPEMCLQTLAQVLRRPKFLVNHAALKMTMKVVKNCDRETVEENLGEIVPGLIQCFDHEDRSVYANSLFCLEAIHSAVGEDILMPHLADLSETQIKELNIFMKASSGSTG